MNALNGLPVSLTASRVINGTCEDRSEPPACTDLDGARPYSSTTVLILVYFCLLMYNLCV